MIVLIGMLVLGRLVIWTAQTSTPTKRLWSLHPILAELGDCDFCLGFWVYFALAMILKVNLLDPYYVPFLAEALTALAASFGVHLARIGWTMQYGVLDLTED